jgi:hypothetical protein
MEDSVREAEAMYELARELHDSVEILVLGMVHSHSRSPERCLHPTSVLDVLGE